MNIKERYLWIAAIILAGFFVQSQANKINNLHTLITTYDMETKIQDAQINDIAQQVHESTQLEYSKGFEAGKTQAAIVLMNKESLYNYTDGYHAAVSQFGVADSNGAGLSQDFLLELLLDTLDQEVETEESYLDIIEDLLSNKEQGVSID